MADKDEIKISTGPVSSPIKVEKPDVPDVVGDLAGKLKQYNKEGKRGY